MERDKFDDDLEAEALAQEFTDLNLDAFIKMKARLDSLEAKSDYITRLVGLVIQKNQNADENFTGPVVVALREYADAVERCEMGNSANEVFRASNSCQIQVFAGGFHPVMDEKAAK